MFINPSFGEFRLSGVLPQTVTYSTVTIVTGERKEKKSLLKLENIYSTIKQYDTTLINLKEFLKLSYNTI